MVKLGPPIPFGVLNSLEASIIPEEFSELLAASKKKEVKKFNKKLNKQIQT